MQPSDQGPTTELSLTALARWICVELDVLGSPAASSSDVYRRTGTGTSGTRHR